jgi:hypothetical protein
MWHPSTHATKSARLSFILKMIFPAQSPVATISFRYFSIEHSFFHGASPHLSTLVAFVF